MRVDPEKGLGAVSAWWFLTSSAVAAFGPALMSRKAGASVRLSPMINIPVGYGARSLSLNTPLSLSSDPNAQGNGNAESLKEQAAKARLEAERMETSLALEKIDSLERQLREGDIEGKSRAELTTEIDRLAQKIDPTLMPASLSQVGSSNGATTAETTNTVRTFNRPPLSSEELAAATSYLQTLSLPLRMSLAKVAGYESYNSVASNPSELVLKLYEQYETITTAKLQDTYRATLDPLSTQKRREVEKTGDEMEDMLNDLMLQMDENYDPDEAKIRAITEQWLPRVTRKEDDSSPTEADVTLFCEEILDSSTFRRTGKPKPIPGGYIIEGTNSMNDGSELVKALDEKLQTRAPKWDEKFQFCYMRDFTRLRENQGNNVVSDIMGVNSLEDLFLGEPALVVLSKDMSPTASRWFLSFISSLSLSLALLFGLGTYGSNEFLTKKLEEMNAMGDYSGLGELNEQLLMFLGPLALIQALHELGHLAIGWKDKIKTSPPTILPSTTLPFLGCQTQIKTSPKNYKSLFDFALIGPSIGIISSVIFLFLGLQLTATADPATAQIFPRIPVGFLNLSTLGGTIVNDYFGGMGLQDPTANIPLHPYAIAGFTSLIVNALELLPFGNTDGGRISQSIFGRFGHSLVGGFTFAVLVGSLFFLPGQRSDIFLGFLLVNGFAQKDNEIPCRDELEKVDVFRILAGFVTWFVAVLILVPMS